MTQQTNVAANAQRKERFEANIKTLARVVMIEESLDRLLCQMRAAYEEGLPDQEKLKAFKQEVSLFSSLTRTLKSCVNLRQAVLKNKLGNAKAIEETTRLSQKTEKLLQTMTAKIAHNGKPTMPKKKLPPYTSH